MKKLLPVIILLTFGSPVFAQATFPITNKRIVTDVWCDFLATKIEAQAQWWANQHNDIKQKTPKQKKQSEEQKKRSMALLANQSTTYKNLCEGSVYLLIKDTLKRIMPTINP